MTKSRIVRIIWWQCFFFYRVDHLVVVFVRPRELASVHFPQHNAKAVQVHLFRDGSKVSKETY
jgi:hypothetical protein